MKKKTWFGWASALTLAGCAPNGDEFRSPPTSEQATPLQASDEAFWTEEELSKDRVVGGVRYVHVGRVTKWAEEGEYEANEAKRQADERSRSARGLDTSSQKESGSPEEIRRKLAEDMRGVAYFKGHEYRQVEPAWAIADAILSETTEDSQPPLLRGDTGRPPEDFQGQRVNGADGRSIQRSNTSYPFRPQLLLRVGASSCTATLIGPSTAITAAHCFHTGTNPIPGNWATSAGVDSQDVPPADYPYGTYGCQWGVFSQAYVNGNTSGINDYAVIDYSVCNTTPGNTVGWLGVWAASDAQIANQTMYLYGYPGNNADCIGGCKYPSIWGMGSSVNAGAYGSSQIAYDTDMTGGQSGAGVYIIFNGMRYIVGINKGDLWTVPDGWFNYGRRTTTSLMAFIEANSQWRRSSFFSGGYASQ